MKTLLKIIGNKLKSSNELVTILEGEYFWHLEKPMNINPAQYIVFKTKDLSGGFVRDIQLEFNIICPSSVLSMDIKEELIKLFDIKRGLTNMNDGTTYVKSSKLLNGGGIIKNTSTGNYETVLFFLLKI